MASVRCLIYIREDEELDAPPSALLDCCCDSCALLWSAIIAADSLIVLSFALFFVLVLLF